MDDPLTLGIGVALALMLTGLAFSLSRGGWLALAGAAIVCLLLQRIQCHQSSRRKVVWAVAGGSFLALILVSVCGVDQITHRAATIRSGEALRDDRFALWSRCPALVRQFPIWGTGYGTFQYVKPLYRTNAADSGWAWEHAHNDYLEALVEGGVLRLILTLAAIALVFRLGCRALRIHRARSAAGLALGALLSFTTVVIHSFVDFGLHIAAVAVFAAVICAQSCGLADAPKDSRGTKSAPVPPTLIRWRWPAPGLARLAAAVLALTIRVVLCHESWRAFKAQSLRLTGFEFCQKGDSPSLQTGIKYLEAAAQLVLDYARLEMELGETYLTLFEKEMSEVRKTATSGDADLSARAKINSELVSEGEYNSTEAKSGA
jgi:hypothetical protein